MNFVESNGKKIAAVLCVASCFPVVATVYAMETAPGWHGDKYIKDNDAKLATGWQEIDDQSYYFSEEDGTVDTAKTREAVTATVSSTIKEDIATEVKAAAEEAAAPVVEEAAPAPVEAAPVEEAVVEAPVVEEAAPVVEEAAPVVEEAAPVEEAYVAPVEETYVAPEEAYVAPVEETYVAPEETYVAPEETYVAPEETYVAPEETYVAPEETYVAPVEETYVDPNVDQNAAIANAAQGLVDTTDGWQCTQVATAALNAAGVDCGVMWPDEYLSLGYVTADPVAGNLIYYDNGGRGLDHIAVYIGDGQAVHGNYNGETVEAAAEAPWLSNPTYIQVY